MKNLLLHPDRPGKKQYPFYKRCEIFNLLTFSVLYLYPNLYQCEDIASKT